MFKLFIKFLTIVLFNILFIKPIFAEKIDEIKVSGNERISSSTIILFSDAKINDDVDENELNLYLKNLYETNF